MNELTLMNFNGIETIDSRQVAEAVEKEHSKLLRDIRTYCEYLNESKIGLVDFFIESTYKDNKGEERPCYLCTRKGCEMIANKLTGQKGIAFTALYINAFHKMENYIKEQRPMDSYMIENPVERAKRWIEEYEERKALEMKIEHQQELIKAKDEKLEKCKPFIQFAMKLQNTNDTVSMEQAAKILKEDGIEIGRNTLFKLLREHKVLMENNSPYQKYMDLDLFEIKAVIKEDKHNKEHMFPVTRVTGKGLIFINKKLRDWFSI